MAAKAIIEAVTARGYIITGDTGNALLAQSPEGSSVRLVTDITFNQPGAVKVLVINDASDSIIEQITVSKNVIRG